MTKTPRQKQILSILEERRKAAITFLAETLEVSDETIRRDLKLLSEEGTVEKFHGGVRLSVPRSEAPFDRRLRDATSAKAAIASRAAARIPGGATVMLDNSSSACFLARALLHREPMTILTISLEIASILQSANSHHRLILPPGELRMSDRTLASSSTIEFLTRFTPSHFAFSVVAGSARGCSDFDMFEADFKRAIIPQADETIVLIDSSKFGKSGLIHVCDWSEVDVLVADAVPSEIYGHIENSHLLIADISPQS